MPTDHRKADAADVRAELDQIRAELDRIRAELAALAALAPTPDQVLAAVRAMPPWQRRRLAEIIETPDANW